MTNHAKGVFGRIYRQRVQGESLWFRTKFWALMVLASPILLALYLGAWAEGWVEDARREQEMDDWAKEADHDG